jgi:L-threonylcarbamoyladenylate synthase
VTSPLIDNAAGELVRAAAALRAGQCVAFPTETVYGLGADATNAAAAARIFALKGRPRFDPLIVHLATAAALDGVAAAVSATARALAERFWPGPLTLVLPKRAHIPDLVTAGLPSLAVRVPDHPLARRLIELAGVPVAAPSANPFGYISPTTAAHVRAQLGGRVDIIVDGGPCRVGLESTIVSLLGPTPEVLRPGAVTVEDLRAAIGDVALARRDSPLLAPGQLPRHYAPRRPLRLIASPAEVAGAARAGAALLAPAPVADTAGFAHVELLSATGDACEIAARLFAALRRLDTPAYTALYALPVREEGLGRAIMDRLRRAAAVT